MNRHRKFQLHFKESNYLFYASYSHICTSHTFKTYNIFFLGLINSVDEEIEKHKKAEDSRDTNSKSVKGALTNIANLLASGMVQTGREPSSTVFKVEVTNEDRIGDE